MKYIIGKNIKSFNSINDYHGLGKEVAKALAEGKEVDIKNPPKELLDGGYIIKKTKRDK